MIYNAKNIFQHYPKVVSEILYICKFGFQRYYLCFMYIFMEFSIELQGF